MIKKKSQRIEVSRLLEEAPVIKEKGLRELICVIGVVIHIMIILVSVGGGGLKF